LNVIFTENEAMQKITAIVSTVTVLVLLASLTTEASIYKTIDKDGNVIFTDVPPKDDSETVKLETYNTYKAVTPPAAPTSVTQVPAEQSEEVAGTRYEVLSIATPRPDESIRENAGNLIITVSTTPEIATTEGHSLEVLLDGKVMSSGSDKTIALTNVDRGTHQLSAQITNSDGDVLITSPAVEFHMLRASRLNVPKNPAPNFPRPQAPSSN
jgi:uncharacterized protein DUF4124